MTKPSRDELEISLFGPGVGESVVLHLGDNEWIVVDSCRGKREPAALEYLQALGVNLAADVKLIVATHWHNDHIRGLEQIVRTCPAANFFCSRALFSQEFLALAELWDEADHERSAVSELYRVVKFFAAEGLAANGRIKFAGPNRRIRRRSYELKGSTHVCEIFSLSPSDHEIARSYNSLSDLMPQIKDSPRKPLPAHPNDTSVVLSVRSGYVNVLLGADLEETNDEESGWRVVIASEERPAGKASVFKVPHHGSATSDNPNVWSEMLESEPHAILTSYKSGRTPLPQPGDIERILKYTPRAYLTSSPRQKSRRSRSGAVGKTMYQTVRRIWTVDDSFSQIQLRRDLTNRNSEWFVRLGGGAVKLPA